MNKGQSCWLACNGAEGAETARSARVHEDEGKVRMQNQKEVGAWLAFNRMTKEVSACACRVQLEDRKG